MPSWWITSAAFPLQGTYQHPQPHMSTVHTHHHHLFLLLKPKANVHSTVSRIVNARVASLAGIQHVATPKQQFTARNNIWTNVNFKYSLVIALNVTNTYKLCKVCNIHKRQVGFKRTAVQWIPKTIIHKRMGMCNELQWRCRPVNKQQVLHHTLVSQRCQLLTKPVGGHPGNVSRVMTQLGLTSLGIHSSHCKGMSSLHNRPQCLCILRLLSSRVQRTHAAAQVLSLHLNFKY